MFTEQQFQKYLAFPYSSGPGGDLSTVGDSIRALVCLCGHPVKLGRERRSIPGPQQEFEKCFQAALSYRGDLQAWKRRQEELADKLAKLEAIVNDLPRS